MQGASRFTRHLVMLVAAAGLAAGSGTAAFAHDEIAGSVPANREHLDAPISEVLIEFGASVDGVELALVGPDDGELPGDVVIVSETEAKLVFDELTVEGEYLVRYLAEDNGHLLAGAIAFTYGDVAGTGAGTTTWILFGVAAIAILALGALLSLRRSRSPDDDPQVTPELA